MQFSFLIFVRLLKMFSKTLYMIIISLSLTKSLSASSDVQEQLIQKKILTEIINKYDKTIRPDDSVYLTFKISLRQIISVDEKNQIMTSSLYLTTKWTDPRLDWNASNFNGVDNILIPAKTLWLPDLFVINTGYLKFFYLNSLLTSTWVLKKLYIVFLNIFLMAYIIFLRPINDTQDFTVI